jgi:PAS domain S-box-containing protein
MITSDVPFSTLETLFPFYLGISNDLKITQIGRSLKKIYPEIKEGAQFEDYFEAPYGRNLQLDGETLAQPSYLHLLRPIGKDFLLRGQSIHIKDKGYFLAISPWLQSPDQLISLNLGVDDFAVHDPILDLLNVIQSERMAKGEIKQLVDNLSKQKASLKDANEVLRTQNETILETQKALKKQASEARKLAHVASRTDNSVVITNSEGRIEWVNASFERLTEYKLDEILGKRPGDFLQGKNTNPETVSYMSQRLKAQKGFNVEVINYSKTGRPYWLRIDARPIFNDAGDLTHFIAVELDITTQKQTEERLNMARIKAENASKAMSEFLATVSHEIRTPMNGIIGMLEILMDTRLDMDQRHYLSLIRVSSEALLKIINDVLDLSKIQASRFEMDIQPFTLRKLTDQIVGLMAYTAGNKGLTFEILVDPSVHNHWKGDASRLRQIMINLIGNAIKFTEEGSIKVYVNVSESSTSSNAKLCFTVMDTGIGIPENRLEDIFKPFTQIGREHRPNQKGTGLGLSISKKLVELMEGSISVRSKEGQGTEFQVEIPIEKYMPEIRRRVSSSHGKLAISMISDPFTRELISNHLETKGMKYRTFDTCDTGLRFLETTLEKNEPVEYLILDEQIIEQTDTKLLENQITLAKQRVKSFRVIILVESNSRKANNGQYPFADNILFRPLTYESTDGMHRSTSRHLPPQKDGKTSLEASTEKAPFSPSVRLLLTEDHPINLEQMTLLLKRLGITPDIARNGREAVDAVKKKEYDVVLMDCQMPVMNGMEAVMEIRDLNQAGQLKKNPYIIAVTAFALQGDREKCLEAGMDAYITKPVYKKDLHDAIQLALGNTQFTHPEIDEKRRNENLPADMESAFRKLHEELSEETAIALTQALIGMLPEKVMDLERFWEKEDRVAISRFGHSLKSISLMNGLQTLANLSLELEQNAQSLDLQDLQDLIKVTQREMNQAKNDLIDMITTHAPSI